MEESNKDSDTNDISDYSQILILRHARSVFNHKNILLAEAHSESIEFYKNALDESNRDWGISEEGINEWKLAHDIAMNMKIHTVFVSPFRRALETALYIFRGSLDKDDKSKQHPDFENIKFVIVPKLREKLRCSCDIPEGIDKTLSEYADLFPNLNTDLLDEFENRNHYFFEDLDKNIVDEILPKIESKVEDSLQSNLFELMLNKIKLNYPNDTESYDSVQERAVAVKKYIAQYLQNNKLAIEESVDVSSKVIIIAHNFFISEYLLFDRIVDVTKKSRITNWQFVNDSTDYSEILKTLS